MTPIRRGGKLNKEMWRRTDSKTRTKVRFASDVHYIELKVYSTLKNARLSARVDGVKVMGWACGLLSRSFDPAQTITYTHYPFPSVP